MKIYINKIKNTNGRKRKIKYSVIGPRIVWEVLKILIYIRLNMKRKYVLISRAVTKRRYN